MNATEALYKKILPDLQALERLRKPYLLLRGIVLFFLIVLLGLPIFYILYMQLSVLWKTGGSSTATDAMINGLQQLNGFVRPHFNSIAPYFFTFTIFTLFSIQIIVWFLHSRILKLQFAIIPEIIKNIETHLRFSFPYSLTDKKIIASELFQSVDRKRRAIVMSKGLLDGYFNDIHIELSDIIVYLRRPSLVYLLPMINIVAAFWLQLKSFFGRSKDLYSSSNIFRGLFMIADFPKKLHGYTLILPDNYEKYFGFLTPAIQRLLSKKGELVYLEDPRFEKKFVVYSTDQIEARYVLSMGFMENIMKLQETIDRPLLLCFKKQQFYTAIPIPEGLFELDLNQNVTKKETIDRIYRNIHVCINIVQSLEIA